MISNPILEELYSIREKMLSDVDGDIDRLLEGIRRRESESGREFAQRPSPPPRGSDSCAGTHEDMEPSEIAARKPG